MEQNSILGVALLLVAPLNTVHFRVQSPGFVQSRAVVLSKVKLANTDNDKTCSSENRTHIYLARNFGGQNFGEFGGLHTKRQNEMIVRVSIRLGINSPKY